MKTTIKQLRDGYYAFEYHNSSTSKFYKYEHKNIMDVSNDVIILHQL